MGLYLRQSVKLGPIRINFSKSGVGMSAGVTGFRVGIRPDGRQYVHAGRYGLYYRENLTGPDSPNRHDAPSLQSEPDLVYETASARDLGVTSTDEVLRLLQRSYALPRTDIGAIVATTFLSALFLMISTSLAAAIATVGLVISAILFRWETARRELTLNFSMDEAIGAYTKLVGGLNELAGCSAVWMQQSATYTAGHQKKVNAGADRLVERSRIQIGSSTCMPWVKCNFTIPTLKNGPQVNYFLPNGIFVFEGDHVGHVPYDDINIVDLGPQRHIEDETVPADAQVVDHTWQYANKNGGPDRRFSNNFQIPICLYGQAEVTSKSGLHWLLETSDREAAHRFVSMTREAVRDLASKESPVVAMGTQHFGQSLGDFIAGLMRQRRGDADFSFNESHACAD